MYKTTSHLFSNILSTGNKFIITDKSVDSTFGPGTIGIMHYVKGVDTAYTNVVYIQATILRRGKHGMPRLDTNIISFPIFKLKDMNSAIMPDKKRKHYVYIEPKTNTFRTIYEMSDLDYLGWGTSWINYLTRLSHHAKPFYVELMNKNIIGKMLNITNLWKTDPQHTIDVYCSNEARRVFINQMRIIESIFVKCSISYMLKVSELELKTIKYLATHNVYNKKILNETYSVFAKKYANLKILENRNSYILKKETTFPF